MGIDGDAGMCKRLEEKECKQLVGWQCVWKEEWVDRWESRWREGWKDL